MSHKHVHHLLHDPTRGFGLFEKFLAKKRASIANKLISSNLRNGRVLDVGCGSFPYFLITTKFKEKYGVDYSIHEQDFSEYGDIRLKTVNIEDKKLPFKDNFFDAVVTLAVFEHIHDDNLVFVLSEINRVLKKDGVFVMTTPAPWSAKLLWLLSRIGLVSKVEIDEHKNFHIPSEVEEILSKANFSKNKIKKGFFEMHLNMYFRCKK